MLVVRQRPLRPARPRRSTVGAPPVPRESMPRRRGGRPQASGPRRPRRSEGRFSLAAACRNYAVRSAVGTPQPTRASSVPISPSRFLFWHVTAPRPDTQRPVARLSEPSLLQRPASLRSAGVTTAREQAGSRLDALHQVGTHGPRVIRLLVAGGLDLVVDRGWRSPSSQRRCCCSRSTRSTR